MKLTSCIKNRIMHPSCKRWNVTYYFADGFKRTCTVNAANRRFAIWNAREETGIWTAEKITASVVRTNKEN